MRTAGGWSFIVVFILLNLGVSPGDPSPPPDSKLRQAEIDSTAVRVASGRQRPSADPFSELSADRLLDTLTELTAIGDHNGWRHSTSRGEAEAIAYVENRLSRMGFLRSLGIELEKEEFRTFMGIEFRRSRVHLLVDGESYEIPADVPPGHRDRLDLALRFDSDGILNDTDPDPVIVTGPPIVVRTADDIEGLVQAEVTGRIVLLDYAAVDPVINSRTAAIESAWRVAEMQPAGIVMVTTYSNSRGLSHGSFAGDLPAFTWVEVDPMPPVFLVRIEDMEEAGLHGW